MIACIILILVDLPSRSSTNQDYCVVAFSVVHQLGSLATALMAFKVSINYYSDISIINA